MRFIVPLCCTPSPLRRIVAVAAGVLALLLPTLLPAQPWVRLARPETSPSPELYGIHFFDGLNGFVCGERSNAGVLYVTANGGVTWTLVTTPGSTDSFNDVVFPGNGSTGILVGNNGYVAVSTDAGVTWVAHNVTNSTWPSGGDIKAVYAASSGWPNTMVVVGKALGSGNGPRMARTTNGGVTWTDISLTGPANNLYDIDFFNATRGAVVGTGLPPRRSLSNDGGITWEANAGMVLQPYAPPASLSFYSISAVPGTATGFAAGGYVVPPAPLYSEVRRTRDYGATWDSTGFTRAQPNPAGGVLAVDTNLVYVSTQNFTIYRSMDGGATWTPEAMPVGPPMADLRRFCRIPGGEMFCVGSAGTTLRSPAPPNIVVSTDSVAFSKSCPGTSPTRTILVRNTGSMLLLIDSIRIVQPAQPDVAYTILHQPTAIAPNGTDSIVVRSSALPAAVPGLYLGELVVFNNDELYAGTDREKHIKLSTPITTRLLLIDTLQGRDAGTVRVDPGISGSIILGSFFTVTGECPVTISSVRMQAGTDFRVLDPTASIQLSSGQTQGLFIEFQPTRSCLRLDTLIIEHNALNYPSPLRLPVRGFGVEPSFQTSPRDTLDFGGVLVGQTKIDTLALLNRKTGTCLDRVRLDTMRIVGPNAADFSAGQPITRTTVLQPDDRLPIAMSARPSVAGLRVAYAVIEHEIGGQSPDTVVLLVNGLQSELTTLNNVVNFATTDVGGQRDSVVVDFVQNLGTAPASITGSQILGANPGDFAYILPDLPTTLPPTPQGGYRQTLTLRFQPTAVGTRTALLRLATSSGNIDVALRGNAEEAVGTTRLSDVNFPSTDVNNCTDSTITQLVINQGNVPLRLDSLVIVNDVAGSGDSLAFQIVSPVVPPQRGVAPGESLAVQIRFCPKRPGPFQVRLRIYNNTTFEDPFTIRMTGTGRARLLVQYDSVVFAPTRVLTVRDSNVVGILSNAGGSIIQIDSAVISGADVNSFTVQSSLPFPLAAGGEAALDVRFEPKRRGQHQAFLTVYHVLGQETILLYGTAVYPRLEVRAQDPSQLRVRLGSSRRVGFTVANVGDDGGRVESVSITGPAYANPSTSTIPVTLMPGDSATVAVDFTPTVFCENPVSIAVRGEGVRGVYAPADTVARIDGFGVAPLVSSRRPQINFGARPIASSNDSTLDSFVGNFDFAGIVPLSCIEDVVVDSIVIGGSGAASFQLLQPPLPLLPQPLAAGDTLRPLAVRFTPATPGTKRAELRIYFGGRADSVRVVELIGTGSVLPIAYGPAPGMVDIDFGRVLVTGERDSLLTLTNTSSAPLSIDNIASAGEFAVLSPSGSLTLAPGVPQNVVVRFAPGSVGQKSAVLVVQSGTLADSSFLFFGVGVTNALGADPGSVEFGNRAVGVMVDTAVLLRNAPPLGISPQFTSPISISDVRIVQGAADFSVLAFPPALAVQGEDSLKLRFTANGPSGRKTGIVRVYFNLRQQSGQSVSDSLDVPLGGDVGGSYAIAFDLGPDLTGKPGDRLHIPVTLSGDGADAAIDSLHLLFGYRRTVLKPLSVTPRQPGVAATISDAAGSGVTGRARLSLRGAIVPGEVANVEFVVALGDSLETILAIDSVVTGRTDIAVERDSIRFTINGFCDAQGRLVRFGTALRVVVTPNPAPRSRTGSIALDLEESAPTTVVLYTTDGREVLRLFDGSAGPGVVTLPFDVSALAAGTYNCILTARNQQASVVVQIVE